jgi:hypothetical protein
MSIESRLRHLEEKSCSELRCATCGHTPDAPGRIVIVEEDARHDPQERCSECGRFLWFTIKVVYEDAASVASEDVGEGATVGREMRRY